MKRDEKYFNKAFHKSTFLKNEVISIFWGFQGIFKSPILIPLNI